MAWVLRGVVPERWVRFHSLPESKRYAESEDEEAEVLHRHLTVLHDLGAPEALIVSSGYYAFPDFAGDIATPYHPNARPWFTADVDGEDAPLVLHASVLRTDAPQLRTFLADVAKDRIGAALLAPLSFEWAYASYDGGADAFAASTSPRDALRDRYACWLSNHPPDSDRISLSHICGSRPVRRAAARRVTVALREQGRSTTCALPEVPSRLEPSPPRLRG